MNLDYQGKKVNVVIFPTGFDRIFWFVDKSFELFNRFLYLLANFLDYLVDLVDLGFLTCVYS